MMGLILVRYGEIGLKGKNQRFFLKKLRQNIKDCLKKNDISGEAQAVEGRLYVYTDMVEEALGALQRVFGIVSLSPAQKVALDIEEIKAEALALAHDAGLDESRSFHIDARRADKTFPLKSPEINRLVGAHVQQATKARVDLSDQADLSIGIEIARGHALLFGRKIPGPGGLPLTSEGRAVALISGGIDSPVAAWLMMKRGCGVIPLHFYQNEIEAQKFHDNCKALARYSHGWEIRPIVLDHAELIGPTLEKLRRIHAERWTCIFCKRLMLQKAAEIARQHKAKAIITGGSLGQVASQTLDNIEVISYGLDMPILRPLIGFDKVETMALAKKIGTFEISTRGSQPCPFLPPNPLTRASLEKFQAVLEKLIGQVPGTLEVPGT
ncbi:MAG: tRNA uracil 4-sulfurtransferase ThiI [Anaerolineae bacterium]